MVQNEAAATAFASLGAICWSIQLIPQIYLNHRRRSTDGFSGLMMILWVLAGVPLGTYNVVQNLNVGLQVQPQLFMFFAIVCTVQTYHYRLSWSYSKSTAIVAGSVVVLGAMEAGMIELLRLGLRRGVDWPVTLVGVLSAVLINVGLIPQFWEIYKRRAVVGVSYVFLGIDCAGAVFSFLSLPFERWDVLAAVSYGLLVLEEVGIFVLGFAFWLRDRRRVANGHHTGKGEEDDEKMEQGDGTHVGDESAADSSRATTLRKSSREALDDAEGGVSPAV